MNMLDYLKWRGDLNFRSSEYNLVDSLVLAYLAYVNFDDVILEGSCTVKEAANRYFALHSMDEILNSKSYISQAPLCLKLMGESDRFKDCIIHSYVNILNRENAEQFAAIIVDIPDNPSVIAFKGTDDTLVGWKEDLILSYSDIPSQFDALLYLNDNVKPFHKYRVIGHSKGGNMAQYAVLNSSESIQNRIVEFVSFDGPGVSKEVFGDPDSKINKRFVKVVPEFDVIGTIYDNRIKPIVVKTNENGLLSHIGFSWQVMGNHFETAEDTNKYTKMMIEAFDSFIHDTSLEQKSHFVDQFFEKLSEQNLNNLSDISRGGMHGLLSLVKSVMDFDDETKKIGAIFIGKFTPLLNESVSEIIDSKKEDVKKLASEIKENTMELFKRKTNPEQKTEQE